jgi:allantoinase
LLQAKAKVNVGYWGGIVPENAANRSELAAMLRAGAHGFKSFISPSGINDFGNVSREHVATAMPFLMRNGVPYFVHAELVSPVETDQVGHWWALTDAHMGWAQGAASTTPPCVAN